MHAVVDDDAPIELDLGKDLEVRQDTLDRRTFRLCWRSLRTGDLSLFDIVDLRLIDGLVLARRISSHSQEEQRDQPDESGKKERPVPAVRRHDPGKDGHADSRGHTGTDEPDGTGLCFFLNREPGPAVSVHHGKMQTFPKSQQEAGQQHHAQYGSKAAHQHGHEPDDDGHDHGFFGAQDIA